MFLFNSQPFTPNHGTFFYLDKIQKHKTLFSETPLFLELYLV